MCCDVQLTCWLSQVKAAELKSRLCTQALLMDYDITSNWGNWVAAAGLTGGRINHFNIAKQSKVGPPSGTVA